MRRSPSRSAGQSSPRPVRLAGGLAAVALIAVTGLVAGCGGNPADWNAAVEKGYIGI